MGLILLCIVSAGSHGDLFPYLFCDFPFLSPDYQFIFFGTVISGVLSSFVWDIVLLRVLFVSTVPLRGTTSKGRFPLKFSLEVIGTTEKCELTS